MAKQTELATQSKALDFFKQQMEGMAGTGIIIPETPLDVLCSLKEGKFKDAALESLGEEMPMFIVTRKKQWGIPPWDKGNDGKEPEARFYGEAWFVPAGGKLGFSKMICRMIKPASQIRLLEQAITRLTATGLHPSQVIWEPKFVEAKNEYGSYYKLKFTYRMPESDQELEQLDAIVELLQSDPELTQLKDYSTGLLYMEDLSKDQRKALVASMQTVKLDIPQLAAASAAEVLAIAAGNAEEAKHRALPQSEPENEPKYVTGHLTDDF
jgi:hypothetical protein